MDRVGHALDSQANALDAQEDHGLLPGRHRGAGDDERDRRAIGIVQTSGSARRKTFQP